MNLSDIHNLDRGDLDNLDTVATVCDLLQSLSLPEHISTLLQSVCSACYSLMPDTDAD